ncbi:hypothetical protein [Aliamphritea spongicola]
MNEMLADITGYLEKWLPVFEKITAAMSQSALAVPAATTVRYLSLSSWLAISDELWIMFMSGTGNCPEVTENFSTGQAL